MRFLNFIIFAVALISSLCSCEKDENKPIIVDPSEQTELKHAKDETPFVAPSVTWLGESNEFATDFAKRTLLLKSNLSEDDKIIFTTLINAKANIETITKAYEKGSVIIIISPALKHIAEFLSEHGWIHMCPNKGSYLFYAFSKRGSFSLKKPKKCNPKPICEDISGAEAIQEYSEIDLEEKEIDPYSDYNSTDPAYYVGPMIKWINGMVEPYTKAGETSLDGDGYTEYLTWDCDLFVHNCGAGSSDDRIQGIFQAGFTHKYTTLYCQNDGEGYLCADYYSFSTTYFADPKGVWKGDDYTQKHGGIAVHITGAFMRELNFKSYISGDGNNPKFYCHPLPSTDNNTVNYRYDEGFSIGGGVTAGESAGSSGKVKPSAEASFTWGYHEDKSVSASVSDVSVTNNSTLSDTDSLGLSVGSSVAWQFQFGNLPTPSGDKGFNCKCPTSARSFQSYPTQWVWYSTSQKSGSTKSIGNLVNTISPILGGCHNGLCVTGQNNTWELDSQSSSSSLIVPCRIEFGTLQIENDLGEGYIISDIVVTSHDEEQYVAFSSKSDILNGKNIEFSIPVDSYDISAMVWNDETETETKYVLKEQKRPYEIEKRDKEESIQVLSFKKNFTPSEE